MILFFYKEIFFLFINDKKGIIENNTKNLKVCLCTLAKLENRYLREFVQHYEKYGVDKIFLYDNNDINGENFEEVINDYIRKGFVEVMNWRGEYLAMIKIMNDCYKKNYHYYDWLIFYEIDEHIFLYNYTNIKLFLNQSKYNRCQEIYLNLVCHTDNNRLFYEDKPLAERFPLTVPKTRLSGRRFEMKSIIRGHINGVNITNVHLGDLRLKSCNNSGLHENLIHFTYFGDQKYYYIDHYYSKSTEEFIKKVNRGDAFRNDPGYGLLRINKYFQQNEITKEKIDMIEKGTHINLDFYRKKLMNNNS